MCDRLTFPDLKSVQLMDLSMDKLVSLDFQSLVRCLLLAPRLKTINVRLSDDQAPIVLIFLIKFTCYIRAVEAST